MIKNRIKKLIAMGIIISSICSMNLIYANAETINTQSHTNQWVQIYGHWQYNDTTGNPIKNNWIYDKNLGKYYYLQANGNMATGWLFTNGAYYYLQSDGSMAINTTINGYTVGNDGAWVGTKPSTTINPIIINTGIVNNTQISNSKNTVVSIKTTSDLENYLNENYSSLKTPIGILKFDFTVDENDNKMFPYDFQIETDWGDIKNSKYDLYSFDPSDLNNSIKITDSDKEKTKELLKDYQEKIAKVAMKYFPNKKIKGGFYSSGFKYQYIYEGFYSVQFYSWKNYEVNKDEDEDDLNDYDYSEISVFQWDTDEKDNYDLD